MRIVTAAMLKGMGCDVEAVVHGEQAVTSAAENRFDVIVLDIEMPIMDGITAARSIRRMGGEAAATPLMALSAFLADSVRTGDWRDTFDIALPKPANRNELHEAVKAALARQPAEATPHGENVPPLLDELRLHEIRRSVTRPTGSRSRTAHAATSKAASASSNMCRRAPRTAPCWPAPPPSPHSAAASRRAGWTGQRRSSSAPVRKPPGTRRWACF